VPSTPEVLQAILPATTTFWTWLLTKAVLRDSRPYLHPLVISALLLIAAGIAVSAVPTFSATTSLGKLETEWTLIYAAAMIPGALYNLVQTRYMHLYTRRTPDAPALGRVAVYSLNGGDEREAAQPAPGDNGWVVKLGMLLVNCVFQLAWMLVLLPIDAAPWFGSSPTVAATWRNFVDGWHCVTTCPTTSSTSSSSTSGTRSATWAPPFRTSTRRRSRRW